MDRRKNLILQILKHPFYHVAFLQPGMLPWYASSRNTNLEYWGFDKTFQTRPVIIQRFRCFITADVLISRDLWYLA
jgi:hypothetical protein